MSEEPTLSTADSVDVLFHAGFTIGMALRFRPSDYERAAADPRLAPEHRGNLLALAELVRRVRGES